ncbi:HET-domain-containing protein, partial [Ophiobolus disseminans]
EAFHHEPLDHTTKAIRLVEILPDLSPELLIQCTMRYATVNVLYICLSYRWGAPSPNQQVLVNGKPHIVRQNLFDFLNMIRKTQSTPPAYWIDALCINQADLAERNHQVAQMGDIYGHA